MGYNVKRHVIDIGDAKMDYITFGNGERPMVLIPGLSFKTVRKFGEPIAFLYRMFAREYKVYAFDRKREVPIGYTIRQMADDLAEVMEELEISDANVLGISQGGMIAQYLAIYYPHLVGKLALGVTMSRLNDTARKVITDWIRFAVNDDYDGITGNMLEIVYSESYVKRFGKYFPVVSRFGKPKDMHKFAILARACLTCNTYNDLTKIQCPVFVIGGKKDLVLSGEASEEIAEKLGCESYMYEELGHSAYEEAPDFNRRVLEFFKSFETGDGAVDRCSNVSFHESGCEKTMDEWKEK